jgi:hypothetical protein
MNKIALNVQKSPVKVDRALITRSTVARLTPLALAMASMVKDSFILGTGRGSDRL